MERGSKWCGKSIEELQLPTDVLVAMVRRGQENMIPSGKTLIMEGDVLVIYDS